jgi:hypothetical protein
MKCIQYCKEWFYAISTFAGQTDPSYCGNGAHSHGFDSKMRNWYVKIKPIT